MAFIKIILDDKSLNFLIKNFNKIESELSKMQILNIFNDMVIDGLKKSIEFVDFVMTNISEVNSNTIFKKMLIYAYNLIYVFTPKENQEKLTEDMFDFIFQLIIETDSSENEKLEISLNYLINFGKNNNNGTNRLYQIYKGEIQLEKISLKYVHKWEIVKFYLIFIIIILI